MHSRGVTYFIFALMATILAIASAPLPFAHIDHDDSSGTIVSTSVVRYTQWRICVDQSTENVETGEQITADDCTENFGCAYNDARAARAFTILAIVATAVCCILGLLDGCKSLPKRPVGTVILVLAALAAAVMTLISFAIQLALFSNDCGGVSIKDAEGSKMGPSPIVMIVAFVLTVIMMCLALVLSPPDRIIRPTSRSEPTANENDPYA
jgi:hypothetical protein